MTCCLLPTKRVTGGGCWFCPNAKKQELKSLYLNNRKLFNKLVVLEQEQNIIGNKFNTLKKLSITELKKEFEVEE